MPQVIFVIVFEQHARDEFLAVCQGVPHVLSRRQRQPVIISTGLMDRRVRDLSGHGPGHRIDGQQGRRRSDRELIQAHPTET
jgi:hypothetical protein